MRPFRRKYSVIRLILGPLKSDATYRKRAKKVQVTSSSSDSFDLGSSRWHKCRRRLLNWGPPICLGLARASLSGRSELFLQCEASHSGGFR